MSLIKKNSQENHLQPKQLQLMTQISKVLLTNVQIQKARNTHKDLEEVGKMVKLLVKI